MTSTDALPGLDLPAVCRWMDGVLPGLRKGPISGTVLAGGRSNLTYRITDGTSVWALRRPPLGHVLPTAHDMSREFRVISAMANTKVAAAEPIAFCADPDVMGAPFYLTSFVDGVVLDAPGALQGVDRVAARAVCEQLVDTLIALHEVNPGDVGLADFGRPDGFLGRQVRRWHQQWQSSGTEDQPDAGPVVGALVDGLPAAGRAGIVHGDYRLSNVIYRSDLSGIAAVVDWEMATLGDPLTDVGLMIVYHTLSLEDDLVPPRLNLDDGFLSPEDLIDRYVSGRGRQVADLDWYIAFGYFKLAVISQGIYYRYLQGQTVGTGFAEFGPAVPRLLARAGALLGEGQ